MPEDTGLLGEIANAKAGPLGHGQAGEFRFIQPDMTFIRPFKASGHIKRRGFTRAIGAEQPDNLALGYGQADAINNQALAVGLPNIF